MSSLSFLLGKARNELRQCEARGCGLPRSGLNRWCIGCAKKAGHYGNPHARPLKPSQWSSERQAVRSILAANASHAGLQQVLGLLSSWSARAVENERAFRGAEEVARLVRHGVKALDILTEVAACWLWLQQRPHALPDDRSRDFAISRAVFALAPRPRRQTRGPGGYWPVTKKVAANRSYSPKARPSALAYVGAHLRAVLAPFLANVSHHMETLREQEEARKAAMSAPLQPAVAL